MNTIAQIVGSLQRLHTIIFGGIVVDASHLTTMSFFRIDKINITCPLTRNILHKFYT